MATTNKFVATNDLVGVVVNVNSASNGSNLATVANGGPSSFVTAGGVQLVMDLTPLPVGTQVVTWGPNGADNGNGTSTVLPLGFLPPNDTFPFGTVEITPSSFPSGPTTMTFVPTPVTASCWFDVQPAHGVEGCFSGTDFPLVPFIPFTIQSGPGPDALVASVVPSEANATTPAPLNWSAPTGVDTFVFVPRSDYEGTGVQGYYLMWVGPSGLSPVQPIGPPSSTSGQPPPLGVLTNMVALVGTSLGLPSSSQGSWGPWKAYTSDGFPPQGVVIVFVPDTGSGVQCFGSAAAEPSEGVLLSFPTLAEAGLSAGPGGGGVVFPTGSTAVVMPAITNLVLPTTAWSDSSTCTMPSTAGLSCWTATTHACPVDMDTCVVAQTLPGMRMCSTLCTGAQDLVAMGEFVRNTCQTVKRTGPGWTCRDVLGMSASSCTGWGTVQLGGMCDTACAVLNANKTFGPSPCDAAKTEVCTQHPDLLDCACINAETSSLPAFGGMSYKQFGCYALTSLDATSDMDLRPRCWWPTCDAATNTLKLDSDSSGCPTSFASCRDFLTDRVKEAATITVQTACGGTKDPSGQTHLSCSGPATGQPSKKSKTTTTGSPIFTPGGPGSSGSGAPRISILALVGAVIGCVALLLIIGIFIQRFKHRGHA